MTARAAAPAPAMPRLPLKLVVRRAASAPQASVSSTEPATLKDLSPDEIEDIRLINDHSGVDDWLDPDCVWTLGNLRAKGLVEAHLRRGKPWFTPDGLDVVHELLAKGRTA
jgi:hypothetical protein